MAFWCAIAAGGGGRAIAAVAAVAAAAGAAEVAAPAEHSHPEAGQLVRHCEWYAFFV